MLRLVKPLLGVLALLVVLGVAVPSAQGYDPTAPFNFTTGTSIPAVGVTAHTGACVVGGVMATNSSGSTAFLMMFDATAQPTSGTAPLWQSASCANAAFCPMTAIPPGGINAKNGVYLAFSTSGAIYTPTAGTSAAFWSVLFR